MKTTWGSIAAMLALAILLPLLAHAQGNAGLERVDSLNALAKKRSHEGAPREAVALGELALEEVARRQGTDSETYAQVLADLAGYYSRAGDYDKAIQLGQQALQLRGQLFGEKSMPYAQSLNNVAKYHSYKGNYFEAVRLGRKAAETKEALAGKENADYAQSLSNLAGYFSRMGNYSEAIAAGEEALQIRKRTLGTQHPDYAQSLNNVAKYHFFQGNCALAIKLETEALALREQLYGKQHPDYATALSNLADFHVKEGELDKALRRGEEALEIRRQVLGEKHPECAESMANLAGYHHLMGHHEEAVRLGEQVVALRRDILGEDHPAYAWSLCKLASYYSANQQTDSADIYAGRATEKYTNFILDTFADMTASERNFFWMRMKSWLTSMILQLADKHPTDNMVGSAYNCTLMAKGLLLNSEIEMANLLMESGDQTLMDAYRKLQADRAKLIRAYETPKNMRSVNTDSLKRVITRQERRLVQRSKTYGSYTRSLRIDWRRVRGHLMPGDIAIEFVCFSDDNHEEVYAALVTDLTHTQPTFVRLASQRQFDRVPATEVYASNKLSKLVWQPLAPYLEQARRVYFAPAGELYNIGIESLPHWEDGGGFVADKWEMYRLSSTRELVLARERKKMRPSTALVLGGVDYDAIANDNSEAVAAKGKKTKQKAAKYLPGTKKEAEEIYRCISGEGVETSLYLAAEATEGRVKRLSGHAPGLLHIATHGFYWTDSEVREGGMDDKLQFLSMYGSMDDADRALTRSGLLFAGANHALLGDRVYDQNDDGILTAKEISVLDLRGLDLLVLSACQTGLGKVTGDGVFGLQRGFKKAGVESLLMSLWKVDDKATRLLMTKFYHYLVQGVGKHEALRRAQRDLREADGDDNGTRRKKHAISSRQKRARKNGTKKAYADPHYWAAFILLDAVR